VQQKSFITKDLFNYKYLSYYGIYCYAFACVTCTFTQTLTTQIGNGSPLSIRWEWKKAQDHGHHGESSQRTSAVFAS